jgi:hypothetical protein
MAYNLTRAAAVIAAGSVLALTACTADEEPEPAPYEAAFFDGNTSICEQMTPAIPDQYFADYDSSEVNEQFSDIDKGCIWRASHNDPVNTTGIVVESRIWEGSNWESEAQDTFAAVTDGGYRNVSGLGDAAVLALSGRESGAVSGLMLWVLVGNVELRILAESYTDSDAPWYHQLPFDLLQETAIDMAEAFLTEIGAERAEAIEPQPQAEGESTALPDLCSGLTLDGLSIAPDQEDWGLVAPTLNNCHWTGGSGGESDLWLSAEALSPPAVPESSATDLAEWWTGELSAAKGQSLEIGDEAYLIALDPGASADDNVDQPGTDFAVRIGNVVLQGRYQDGSLDSSAAAEAHATAIADQVRALLDAE